MSEAELNNNQEILRQLENPEFLMDLRKQMLKFTVLQLSSFQQAEDVVQEALVSALQHLGSFSGRAAFKTWVFAILKNKIIDLIRQNSRLVTMTELFDEQDNELSIDGLFLMPRVTGINIKRLKRGKALKK